MKISFAKTSFAGKHVFAALIAGAVVLPAMVVTSRQLQANSKMSMSRASAVPASDRNFMIDAAQGGMAEVMTGQLAARKGANREVRAFGQRMVTDHSKANAQLKQVAMQKHVTLPKSPNAKQRATYAKLSHLSGAAFDRAYMNDMVKDHIEDVTAFQKEASHGYDTNVKSFAAKTLPTLKMHLRIAKSVDAKVK